MRTRVLLLFLTVVTLGSLLSYAAIYRGLLSSSGLPQCVQAFWTGVPPAALSCSTILFNGVIGILLPGIAIGLLVYLPWDDIIKELEG